MAKCLVQELYSNGNQRTYVLPTTATKFKDVAAKFIFGGCNLYDWSATYSSDPAVAPVVPASVAKLSIKVIETNDGTVTGTQVRSTFINMVADATKTTLQADIVAALAGATVNGVKADKLQFTFAVV